MPYRRIELRGEELKLDDVAGLLDDVNAVDRYEVVVAEGELKRLSFLIDSQRTEEVTDALRDQFGHAERFMLSIHEITGLWPRPEQKDNEASGDDGDEKATPEQPFKLGGREISRDELLDDLSPGSRTTTVYLAQTIISSLICAVGMIMDNTALVIGGMVIAPLLLPNMALALGTTLGNVNLMRRALVTGLIGLACGFALALVMGLLVDVDTSSQEIMLRSRVSFWDMVVAVGAGAAGALAVTTGVSANLIGVMVAVALVPPLVGSALLLGDGAFGAAKNAGILVALNVVSVNAAAVGVFLLQGVRPATWYEHERARKATLMAAIWWGVLLVGLGLLIWLAAPENPLEG